MPDLAIPLVFRLLGETGAHAPVLNDVVLMRPAGRDSAAPCRCRTRAALGRVGARRRAEHRARTMSCRSAGSVGEDVPLGGRARRALGWWLVGTGRAMLTLARQHALDRVQFGRPVASFQAVRHRLAETLVAIEGAEATLPPATDDLGSPAGQGRGGQGRADRGQTLPAGARRDRLHRRARAAPPREARPACSTGCSAAQGNSTREAGAGLRARRLRPAPGPPLTSARSTKWRDLLALLRPYVGLGEDDYLMLAFISSRFTSTGHPLTLSALPWPVW